MTDELDDIYEISTVANDNFWVPEYEYERISNILADNQNKARLIEFNTLSGSTVRIVVGTICLLHHSNQEQRDISKEYNKKHQEYNRDFD